MKNINYLIVQFAFMLILTGITEAQISVEWVKSYNPISNHAQGANDAAVDDGGSIYVLGYNGRGYNGTDVALVKYRSNGDFRWARSYDGGNENNSDIGFSLTTVKRGDSIFIYTLSNVSISGYGNYAGISKYDSSGNLLWTKNCLVGWNSSVSVIKSDSAGNIYAAGGTSAEAFLMKLNTGGDTLWIEHLPVPSGYINCLIKDITLDASGNIYGTGKINNGNISHDDIITFKYNNNGALQWSVIYNYGFQNDVGNSIELSQSGNLYVTGGSDPSNVQDDIVTIKYNPSNGDSVWVSRFNGALNQYDIAMDIVIDANENNYITGQTDGATFSGDMATLKYSSNGSFQWMKKYAGSSSVEDAGKEIALDTSGNIYVSGKTNTGSGLQFIGIKYNSNGDSLWTRLYDFGTSLYEDAKAMVLDKDFNMIITGDCNNLDMGTVKFSSSGILQWGRVFYAAQLIGDFTNSIVNDKNGNVYMAGKSRVSQNGDQFTLIKYNPEGIQVWYKSYGVQLFDNFDAARAMTIDTAGYIYVTGTSVSRFNNLTMDYLTFKFDTSGNQLWYATFNGGGNREDDARAIATDNSGNIYVTGQSVGATLFGDYCTVKYSSTGAKLWERYYNGTGNGVDYAYDVTTDQSGNVYVTGQIAGNGSNDDIATVKYSSTGTELWVQRFNGTGSGTDIANNVETDFAGNVYVSGSTYSTGTGYNSILIKYGNDASGTLKCSKQESQNNGDIFESANAIKLDSAKSRIYLAGTWANDDDGRKTQFAAKYDTSGYRIYRSDVLYYLGGSETYSTGLYLDKNQNVYISGQRIYNNANPPEVLIGIYDSAFIYFSSNNLSNGIKNSMCSPDAKDIISLNKSGCIFIGCGSYDSTAGMLMSVVKYNYKPYELSLKLYLQGFYNSATNLMIQDTVNVYLRYAFSPFAMVDSSKSLINTAGTGICKFDNNYLTQDGIYFLQVRHRNSIETWTANNITFTSGLANYDFTLSAAQAFGSNQIQVDASPVRFAVYCGDVNQDGSIDGTDLSQIDNDASNFSSGYQPSDLNGDESVDGSDLAIADNNSSNFVSKITPETLQSDLNAAKLIIKRRNDEYRNVKP
ncbi:MAG: hypothetical protein HGGPFJEG_00262 [Ignavibacteria bacterium]|nr:hypothetical protein [Ignavibacteria bacterium]